MCDGNLAMANSLEYEDEFFENCPECGKLLYDIEFDMQYCEECGWGTNNAKTSCPQCGYEFDDADFDFQICHKCGWNGNNKHS